MDTELTQRSNSKFRHTEFSFLSILQSEIIKSDVNLLEFNFNYNTNLKKNKDNLVLSPVSIRV